MLSAVNREALTLTANGVVALEEVDRAWMGVMKMPIGPFGIMDLVGLDTVWGITDLWARTLGDPQLRANADFVQPYVDRGELGVNRSRLLAYPDPASTAGVRRARALSEADRNGIISIDRQEQLYRMQAAHSSACNPPRLRFVPACQVRDGEPDGFGSWVVQRLARHRDEIARL
jgi:3-hydroxyacyl-CoA dehydrogenase